MSKRPVAWRVKDFADGWILFTNEYDAYRHSEETGALMQGLYVRDGRDPALNVTDVGPAAGEPVTGWIDPDAPHEG